MDSFANHVLPYTSRIAALGIMAQEFHTTQTITNLSIAMYMIGKPSLPKTNFFSLTTTVKSFAR